MLSATSLKGINDSWVVAERRTRKSYLCSREMSESSLDVSVGGDFCKCCRRPSIGSGMREVLRIVTRKRKRMPGRRCQYVGDRVGTR